MTQDRKWLIGDRGGVFERELDNTIAADDHKIRFVVQRCAGRHVLDLGCVQHNPRNYESRYWLHKAIASVAASVVGVDIYEEGVRYLRERGFDVVVGDAQRLDLGRTFDVIVAGDLVEHLENLGGFLESCEKHMHAESKLLVSSPNPWYWKNVLKAALSSEVKTNPEHTCWLCPRTLRQLCNRHGLDLGAVVFGSRYLADRAMPLPKGWRHTSFHAEVHRVP